MSDTPNHEAMDARRVPKYGGTDHLLADAIRRAKHLIRKHGLDGLEPELLRPEPGNTAS